MSSRLEDTRPLAGLNLQEKTVGYIFKKKKIKKKKKKIKEPGNAISWGWTQARAGRSEDERLPKDGFTLGTLL